MMPAVTDKPTREVKGKDLADMLDVQPAALSQAVRRTHRCKDYPVFDWAKWHPNGKQIDCYEVPVSVLKEKCPEDEYTKFGIFD